MQNDRENELENEAFDKPETEIAEDVENKEESNNENAVTNDGDKQTKSGKKIFTELWFILTLCGVAFITVLVILISIARGGGLSWKNLFGKSDGDLDFVNDSLDSYINIKESEYKGIEINVPMKPPSDIDVENAINRLIATNRNLTPKGTYTNVPVKLGYDVNISYLGYQLDDDGRRFLVPDAGNYKSANTKTDRYTIGLNSDVFGIGFDEGLIGKTPNGKLGGVRDYGNVMDGNIIYATVSFILDNGLVYDEVEVAIDPSADNFEKCWGIGAYENLFKNVPGFDMITLTGNSYMTFPLEDGGQITYTALTVNYVSAASVAPITVESYFAFDYTVEELRNEKVYFDVYIESVVEYDVPELDEKILTEKLKLSADTVAALEGTTPEEKCKSYYKEKLAEEYDAVCKSYVEYQMWAQLKKNISVTMYPQKEVDRIYVALVEDYSKALLEENTVNNSGYTLDEYMREALGLGEGEEWTSYLLAQVKDTVKERLIVYSVGAVSK